MIRSYYRDFAWLRHCLASLDRYAAGFSRRIVVVPESSADWLATYGLEPADLVVCADARDDYVGQQLTKLYADELSDADFIVHFDSDCVVARTLEASDCVENGRPVIWMTHFDELSPNSGRREGVVRLLGVDVPYDFMRRMPIVFPRWLYSALREHVVARFGGGDFRAIVASLPPGYLSEFNLLASFAYLYQRDAFGWRLVPAAATDGERCRFYWSRGGLSEEIEREIASILSGS